MEKMISFIGGRSDHWLWVNEEYDDRERKILRAR